MTNLGRLQYKLAILRRRRALRRWVCCIAPVGTGGLTVLVAVFWLDFGFQMDVIQRAVTSAGGLLMLGWILRRFSHPFLRRRETELESALQVEHHHGIQDQLVAALQFDTLDSRRHGSKQLESAVIDHCQSLTHELDVFRGFRYRPMLRRGTGLLVGLVVTTGAAVSYPNYAKAFLQRLVWQPARYPTATIVRSLTINSQSALVFEQHATLPHTVACAEGEAVDFVVESSGPAVAQGTLRLAEFDGQGTRTIKLTPDTVPANDSRTALRRRYVGRLRRLVAPLRYQVFLGDTWTDPAEIRMIKRPLVKLTARVERPRYTLPANSDTVVSVGSSAQQLNVPQGSNVHFQVSSTNGKPLREVRLSLTDPADGGSYLFSRHDQHAFRWDLASQETVFARVQSEIQFEVQVTDRDGLQLEEPLTGVLSVQPDRGPSVVIDSPHRVVLPLAEPSVEFQISDDFAISTAVLHARIRRVAASEEVQSAPAESYRLGVPLDGTPIPSDRLPVSGSYSVPLRPWSLQKGDQLTLALEVTDDRGDNPGVSSVSEPLVLQVSDEHGVISAISEMDQQSERQLGEVIERQLEVAR